jgi:hypothetical protein
MANTKISDLKTQLNGGSRKNKFLLEFAVPGINSKTINILCKSSELPQITIGVSEVWYKGRKYGVRSKTQYPGEYQITIIDDNKLTLRQAFDSWLKQVDDSTTTGIPGSSSNGLIGGLLSGTSYESTFNSAMSNINTVTNLAQQAKNVMENPTQTITNFVSGALNSWSANSVADYQTDFNIWQLTADGQKLYGYKIQNAFPKDIGNVEYSQDSINELVEFTVTFQYSEFIPLTNNLTTNIATGLLGSSGGSLTGNIETLFS